MDEIILTIFLILAFLIPIAFGCWLIYILYSIPFKSGNKKLGIILSTLATITFLYFGYNLFFDNSISRRDIRNYIQEQNFRIQDDFEILENQSIFGIGDYYHTFTIEISDSDKENFISDIQKSYNFRQAKEPSLIDYENRNYEVGHKVIDNIEADNHFIRVLFIENKDSYAPTFRVIKISKTTNLLQFEDIDE